MKANKKNVHLCQICAKQPIHGQEHVPPQAVSNRGRMKIYYIAGNDKNGKIKYYTTNLSDGFYTYSLCEDCNKRLGGLYVNYYRNFVNQVAQTSKIVDTKGRIFIRLQRIYPLRIIKQIYAMFLAIQPFEPTNKWQGLQDFVLDETASLPASAPFVFLYLNTDKIGRIAPFCGICELATHKSHKSINIAEISFPPLGIVISFQQDDRFALMAEITDWGRLYCYNDSIDTTIQLPQLKVSTYYPLAFGNSADVEKEIAERLPVYLFHVPDDSKSPTNFSVLLSKYNNK